MLPSISNSNQEDLAVRLNIGCGAEVLSGWTNIDLVNQKGVDLVFDLNSIPEHQLPIAESSVKSILLSHVLEHLNRPLDLMQELWRVAQNGCNLVIRVPHGGNDEAWLDPTHRRPYFPRSFIYFGQPKYHKFDYGYLGDWRCHTILMATSSAREGIDIAKLAAQIETSRNVVSEMVAVLVAIKPSRPRNKALLEGVKTIYLSAIPREFDNVINIAFSKY
jgi:hypothetical protein